MNELIIAARCAVTGALIGTLLGFLAGVLFKPALGERKDRG